MPCKCSVCNLELQGKLCSHKKNTPDAEVASGVLLTQNILYDLKGTNIQSYVLNEHPNFVDFFDLNLCQFPICKTEIIPHPSLGLCRDEFNLKPV